MRLRCPCGAIFGVSPDTISSGARCPKCGARLTIPAEATARGDEYRVAQRVERRPDASGGVGGSPADAPDLQAQRSGGILDRTGTDFLNAFRYPLSPRGVLMIVAGAVTIPLLDLIFDSIPFIGWIGGVFLSAYVAAFYMSVIEETCAGGEDVPDWPDIVHAGESVVRPALRAVAALIISFLPAIVCLLVGVLVLGLRAFLPETDAPSPTADLYIRAAIILSLLGGIYLPMALLAAGARRSAGSAGPTVVVPAILAAARDYVVVLAFAVGLLIVDWAASRLFGDYVRDHRLRAFLVGIPSFAVNFYFTMALMRALGLLYRRNHRKLAWNHAAEGQR
ncbi:MAG: hypothetical protein V2A58_17345 [Planctomycetota bacterium]